MDITPETIAAIATAINSNKDAAKHKDLAAPADAILLGNIRSKKTTTGTEPWMTGTVVIDGEFVEVKLDEAAIAALAASEEVKVGAIESYGNLFVRKITGTRIKARIGKPYWKNDGYRATLEKFEGLEPYKDAVVPAKFAF